MAMTFQAYLDTIEAKTGKRPRDFLALARKRGLVRPDLKAGELVAWLKDDFGLGRGHAMALWTVFKQEGWVPTQSGTKRPATAPAGSAGRGGNRR
jgi:hypothetical protein